MSYVKPKVAREKLGVTDDTLRAWAIQGKIKCIRLGTGNRLYNIDSLLKDKEDQVNYIYCRVSSSKQKEDLERQVEYLSEKYPNHKVVKEIASGINFKRKGLQGILDRVLLGGVGEIVVAHKDRLCRIAWEHFNWLCGKYGTTILVDGEDKYVTPETELAEDLMSIVHVFSSRHYGARRKYTKKAFSKDSNEHSSEKGKDDKSENGEEEP